jgi:diguanylate cyclase (GGDEF)-like protein
MVNNDRMSARKAPLLEHPRRPTATEDCTVQVYVSGRAAFLCQALWHRLEEAGHTLTRFTEDDALLDAVKADAPSVIVYEVPAEREVVTQFLSRLTELKHNACVLVAGPEIGAELVAQCLRSGAYDYLTVPVTAARLMTSFQEGLVNRQTVHTVRRLSQELAHSNNLLAGERNALKHWNQSLLALNHLTQVLTGSLDSRTIVQSLFTGLATLIPLDIIGLARTEPQQIMTWSRSALFDREEMQVRERLLRRIAKGAKTRMPIRRSHRQSQAEAVLREDCALSVSVPTLGDDRHTMTIPLNIARSTQGVLHVERRQDLFTEAEFHVLSTVGTSLALAFRNADTHQQIQQLASRDSVTGLLNRRALEEILAREYKTGLRYHTSACFLLVDVDYFKMVNDTQGHLAGDQVLRRLAVLMRTVVRDSDTVGRYGGEEFGIVLPHTDLAHARVLAERLRRQIENHEFGGGGESMRLTVSIGIAHIPDASICSVPDWIAAADTALYDAKTLGRNRVAMHVSDQQVSVEATTVTLAAS